MKYATKKEKLYGKHHNNLFVHRQMKLWTRDNIPSEESLQPEMILVERCLICGYTASCTAAEPIDFNFSIKYNPSDKWTIRCPAWFGYYEVRQRYEKRELCPKCGASTLEVQQFIDEEELRLAERSPES